MQTESKILKPPAGIFLTLKILMIIYTYIITQKVYNIVCIIYANINIEYMN